MKTDNMLILTAMGSTHVFVWAHAGFMLTLRGIKSGQEPSKSNPACGKRSRVLESQSPVRVYLQREDTMRAMVRTTREDNSRRAPLTSHMPMLSQGSAPCTAGRASLTERRSGLFGLVGVSKRPLFCPFQSEQPSKITFD